MYRYKAVQGKVLSQTIDLPLFRELLAHAGSFWEPHVLSGEELKNFETRCLRFYKDKTEDRIAKFYRDFERQDNGHVINGFSMPTLEALCNAIDWSWLSQGLPTRFHGDFHPENILWSPSDKTFTYLDWRQDFAGDLVAGDIYYDFAKLLHGLIISHEIIARDLYSVEWKDNNITFDFNRKQMLVECESEFHQWLDAHHYDRKKVRILTALIFLNIAALHHYPYCLLLFALGKSMLFHTIRGQASPDTSCDVPAFHQAIES
jgi:thiamine kinase-like enzyme